MKLIDNINWDIHFNQLVENDYTIIDNFLPSVVYQNIKTLFSEYLEQDLLRQAGIGALGKYQIQENCIVLK